MAALPEDPLSQNGTRETEPAPEPHCEEPTTAVADTNAAARATAETVSSAREERKVPDHGEPDSESDRMVSEGEAQETVASQEEVDLKLQNGESAPTQNDAAAVPDPPLQGPSEPELRKDEGNRTFTMREVLNGLISDENQVSYEAPGPNLNSADSQEIPQQNQIIQDSATADLINSITGADEQGRPRHRVLAFGAKRFASAIERNPGDYDALYNWALILQESADSVGPNSTSPSKDALLEEACKRYEEATRLCPTLHDGYYNWAIAISDRARLHGRTNKGEEMWRQAIKLYEKAVHLNWNSPQALNNWGLALQELSVIIPAKAKLDIVETAISKFRAAIKLQFDFHRAIYNLGTVLYGLAEDTQRSGSSNATERADDLFRQCAIYVAAAHALKPNNSVYKSALRLVRSMLPLPNLKVGFFIAPPAGKPLSPHSEWKRTPFVLNHEGLYQVIPEAEDKIEIRRSLSSKAYDKVNGETPSIKVEIPDVVSVSVSADLTLPRGAGLCIHTVRGSVYLVADSWECLEGWVDALRLVYTIFAKGNSDVLAGVISA